MRAKDVQEALKKLADSNQADRASRFFKTGPGQYAEKDQFIGISVPDTRKVVKGFTTLPLDEIKTLLTSPIHEERMSALFILVAQYKKNPKEVFDCYISHTRYVNNWDLVDCSACYISGPYLFGKNNKLLFELAQSENIWERRIAILSTFYDIKEKSYTTPLAIIAILMQDFHDLIHKAVGWMLREIGKRDREVLQAFLSQYATKLPRTALRYSIEHFSKEERKMYMSAK